MTSDRLRRCRSLRALLLNGDIAQLGERVLCKHEVVGSIPSVSTIRLGFFGVASATSAQNDACRGRYLENEFAAVAASRGTSDPGMLDRVRKTSVTS